MKTKNIFTCAMLALATISCNDLDVDIKSQYTEYPIDSDIALEARISNAYYAFRTPLARRYDELLSLSSDEYSAVCFNGGWLDGRQYSNCSTHSWEASANNNQLNVYSDILAGITNCNQLLRDLGETNPETSNPVRAARAFYTFLLMDNFGDTPIVDYKLTEWSASIERCPRADVARWIETELLAVRDKCPSEVNESTYGTPTCWMVDALLAKLYINWNVYTQDVTSADWDSNAANEKLDDCIAACDRIIKSQLFDLSDDYKEKFMYNNGSHIKDFIYAVPYEASLSQGMCYARYRTWRYGGANGFYTTVLTPSCGGNFAMNPEFAELVKVGKTYYNGQANENSDIAVMENRAGTLALKAMQIINELKRNWTEDSIDYWKALRELCLMRPTLSRKNVEQNSQYQLVYTVSYTHLTLPTT